MDLLIAILAEAMLAFSVFYLIHLTRRGHRLRAEINSRLKERFHLDDQFMSPYGDSFIGVSFTRCEIVLGTFTRRQRREIVVGKLEGVCSYDFDQITSFEVERDGVNVSTTNRGAQLGAAMIGDELFGPVGALVGAFAGSSASGTRIRKIALKVVVNDREKPAHTVIFLRVNGSGASSQSQLVKEARSNVERFHAHLLNIVRQRSLASRE